MHESFFGLQKRPFLAVPTLDRYCPVASQEAAFQSCARAITRGEGPVAILGGTGLGKSMLCLRIGEVFRRSFEVILLASSQICSRRALLQSLLFELRMPYRDLSEGELRLSLLDRLQPSNENPSDGLVLIVDEAQTLSIKLLEELRLITNLTRDGVPRVRLVLCGTLRLEEMLGHPQLESLNQRLACRSYLSPLNQHETICYLTHKVELCGASIQSTFTDDAMRLIHRATDGIPRLIDQLADQSLRLAAESRQRPVSTASVESAWSSLQQIPLPWSDSGTPIENQHSSIEYGSLSDEEDSDFAVERNLTLDTITQAESHDANTSQSDTSIPSEPVPFMSIVASPIPSAGMGLSRVAPLVNPPSTTPIEPSVETEAWDDFVAPSERRFETGIIEDYVDDMLDYSLESSPTPTPPADTIDFEPIEFLPTPIQEIVPEPVPRQEWYSPEATSHVPDDLFGSDFDDEIDVQVESNRFLDASEPVAQNTPDLAYEYSSFSTLDQDEILQPYSELLDSLSTANLEAMTLDPNDSLDNVTNAWKPAEVASQDDFEGGLARQTRSTILSFADLQEVHHPLVADDRDLLIVEDDLPAHGSTTDVSEKEPAAVQPYKQLFSKLRG
jgi:type II secretory pathway predicted ATPase ExeA